jgi:hypothetical protein
MNSVVGEVQRLRQELAEKTAELAELRGLVNKHLELETDAEQRCLEREQAAYERGRDVAQREYGDGFAIGHDVALGAHEEARPFVAGIREGFEAGKDTWKEVSEPVFADLHKRPERQAEVEELEAG